ncbi:MAG: pilus assembly protein [Chlorobiales bacterium]|nr:pilus assembly protein [Chlorobiales bacterium]
MTTMRTDIAMLQPPETEKDQSQKGGVLVEFAFILPILLVVLFGVVSFSVALYNKTVLSLATREGARAGAMFVPDQTDDDIINSATTAASQVLQNNLISFGPDMDPSVAVGISGDPIPPDISGDVLTVTTSVNYAGLFIIYDLSDFLISARTSMRIE